MSTHGKCKKITLQNAFAAGVHAGPDRLLESLRRVRDKASASLLTPLTYIHVGEAKTGEEAQCTRSLPLRDPAF